MSGTTVNFSMRTARFNVLVVYLSGSQPNFRADSVGWSAATRRLGLSYRTPEGREYLDLHVSCDSLWGWHRSGDAQRQVSLGRFGVRRRLGVQRRP
jgi:hypothetical protein